MNRDDLINFAWKAGFKRHHNPEMWDIMTASDEALAVFSDLIAAHETEQCAKLMDDMAARDKLTNYYKVAALAIRERTS